MGCTSSSPIVEQNTKKPSSLPPQTQNTNSTAPSAQPKAVQPITQQPVSTNNNSSNKENSASVNTKSSSGNDKEKKIPVTVNNELPPKPRSPTPSSASSKSLSVELPATQKPTNVQPTQPPAATTSSVPAIVNALKSPYDSDNEDFQVPLTTSVDDSPMASRSVPSKTSSILTQLDFEQFLSHPKIEAIVQIKMTTEEKLCDYYLTMDEDGDGYIIEGDVDKIIEMVKKDHLEAQREQNAKIRRQSAGGGSTTPGNSSQRPSVSTGGGGGSTPGKRLVYKAEVAEGEEGKDEEGFATPSSVKQPSSAPFQSPHFINHMTEITLDSTYSTPQRTPTTPITSNSPTTPFTTDRQPTIVDTRETPTFDAPGDSSPSKSPGNSPFHRQRKPKTVHKFISPIIPSTTEVGSPGGQGHGFVSDMSMELESTTLSTSLFSPASSTHPTSPLEHQPQQSPSSKSPKLGVSVFPPAPPTAAQEQSRPPKTPTTTSTADVNTTQARRRLRSITAGTSTILVPPSKKGFLICSPNKTRGYHVLEGGTLFAMDSLGGHTGAVSAASANKGQVGIDRKGISLQGRQISPQDEKGIYLTAPFYANLNYSTGESISLDLLADNLDPVLLFARNTQDRDEWMDALQQHLEYITSATTSNPTQYTGSILASPE